MSGIRERMRQYEAAAQTGTPKADATVDTSTPRFATGAFVRTSDNPTANASLIMDVAATQLPRTRTGADRPTAYHYLCKGSAVASATPVAGLREAPAGCAWVAEAKLHPYEIVESDFPLLEMPMPTLAHALSFLSVAQGAQVAGLCRKLHSAFQDAVVWRRRCAVELPRVDIDAQVRCRCGVWLIVCGG